MPLRVIGADRHDLRIGVNGVDIFLQCGLVAEGQRRGNAAREDIGLHHGLTELFRAADVVDLEGEYRACDQKQEGKARRRQGIAMTRVIQFVPNVVPITVLRRFSHFRSTATASPKSFELIVEAAGPRHAVIDLEAHRPFCMTNWIIAPKRRSCDH